MGIISVRTRFYVSRDAGFCVPEITDFPQILAIHYIRTHVNFNLPPLMTVLSDFHLLNKISRAFYDFNFLLTGMANNCLCIVEIVLINNLGYKVLMLNSAIKHAFKYEKKH